MAIPGIVAGLIKGLSDLVDLADRAVAQPETQATLPYWRSLLQLFGAELLLPLFGCLCFLPLFIWSKSRINTVLIFDLDRRVRSTPVMAADRSQTALDVNQMLELPAFLLFLHAYCFCLSMFSWPAPISSTAWPAVYLVLAFLVLVNPLPILHVHTRYWFLSRLVRRRRRSRI